MKILTIHNKYKIRGGEDESRESEDVLLQARGHQVEQLIFDNSNINEAHTFRVGIETAWSQSSYNATRRAIKAWRPDIVDIHNFFPLASPSVHYASKREGIPVVQTLHNYRLLCPGATFYRDGKVCEDCTKYTVPLPALFRGCYRSSKVQTSTVVGMITVHRLLRTWQRTVDIFIAVSSFQKRKFVENGFPENRIVVKPNFVLDPGPACSGGNEFLFVGRLAPEKGIQTLLRAMDHVGPGIKLNIVGDGPLEMDVRAAALRNPSIKYLGRVSQREVLSLIGNAICVVFPSEWYETFGRVAAEAFARGTPVIASEIGAVAEIVEHDRTGFYFKPGDSRDLARVMTLAFSKPEQLIGMRVAARREYENKYTADKNYEMMMSIYERALASGQRSKAA